MRREYFRSLRVNQTHRAAAMLLVITFVVLFNCFPAIQNGGTQNTRQKLVRTTYGDVKGHLASDGEYFAYLGIPYAAPPTGYKRFKEPESPEPWQGTYNAIRTVKCPQQAEGDEDCLILNVFTPIHPKLSHLPVIFYIHGGSFLLGSGPTHGMDPLIKQNIIVVTINYRLGALGFLCLGIEEAPGNAGLKDQVAALQWVHENIYYFGGDPHQVTIYGMSAGAASVEYLVLSQAADGFFTKAVLESGSATSVWAIDADPITTAKNVGKILNFPETERLEDLVEYYKTMDVELLTDKNYDYYNNLTDGTFGFVPCVEKLLPEIEPFITESPHEILENGNYKSVPMMVLFTTFEGLYLRSEEYYKNNYKERMESNFLDFMPADLIFEKDKFRVETGRNLRRFYFGSGSIASLGSLKQYLNYFGDCLILHGLLSSCDVHARRGEVYLMEFAYKGGLGGYEKFYEGINAAGHGDAVKYAILNRKPKTEMDRLTVHRVSNLIGNFVKHGVPTPSKTSLVPVTWPMVKPGHLAYLYLNEEFKIDHNPYEERIAFWDQLYAKFRRPVKSVGSL